MELGELMLDPEGGPRGGGAEAMVSTSARGAQQKPEAWLSSQGVPWREKALAG